MSMRTLAYRLFIALIPMTLAACPVPLPSGDDPDSRQNVGDKVPDFIVAGKTTRVDVVLALGEPDRAFDNDTQFTYTRKTSEGGVIFVIPAGGTAMGGGVETMTYRRLVILFDEAGVVTSARYERVSCSERLLGAGNSTSRYPSCVNVSGQDLLPTDSAGER